MKMKMNTPILVVSVLAVLLLIILFFGGSNTYEGFREGAETITTSQPIVSSNLNVNQNNKKNAASAPTSAPVSNNQKIAASAPVSNNKKSAASAPVSTTQQVATSAPVSTTEQSVITTQDKKNINKTIDAPVQTTLPASNDYSKLLLKSSELDYLSSDILQKVIAPLSNNDKANAKENAKNILIKLEVVHDKLLELSKTF